MPAAHPHIRLPGPAGMGYLGGEGPIEPSASAPDQGGQLRKDLWSQQLAQRASGAADLAETIRSVRGHPGTTDQQGNRVSCVCHPQT